MTSPTMRLPIVRIAAGAMSGDNDMIAVEEPLEIRCGDRPLAVTMRTPGDDFDLALGFLLTESIVHRAGDVDSIRHWGSPNVVRVALRDEVKIDWNDCRGTSTPRRRAGSVGRHPSTPFVFPRTHSM